MDALLLAAGKFLGEGIGPPLELHDAQDGVYAPLALIFGQAPNPQRDVQVLHGGPPGQEAEVLKHHADATPQSGQMADFQPVHVVPQDRELALRGALLAEEQPEKGGLTGPGGTGEEGELALGELEVDVVEGQDAAGVSLGDVLEAGDLDHGGSSALTRCQS
jgi:hypothetical protein